MEYIGHEFVDHEEIQPEKAHYMNYIQVSKFPILTFHSQLNRERSFLLQAPVSKDPQMFRVVLSSFPCTIEMIEITSTHELIYFQFWRVVLSKDHLYSLQREP